MLDIRSITHQRQLQLWEAEHKDPQRLIQLSKNEPSSGVLLFWDWIRGKINIKKSEGLEICCGKGRNAFWVASWGVKMFAYDFSKNAIDSARSQAQQTEGIGVTFIIHDATKRLPYKNDKFDLAIDCFGSTDIDTPKGREVARDEIIRVLKPGGFLFVYTLSTDDEFFCEMIKKYPTRERNAFIHPENGKFEKTFDLKELLKFYEGLKLIENRRIDKKTVLYGKEYHNKYFWLVFQKN